jgi:hypothetical protein
MMIIGSCLEVDEHEDRQAPELNAWLAAARLVLCVLCLLGSICSSSVAHFGQNETQLEALNHK